MENTTQSSKGIVYVYALVDSRAPDVLKYIGQTTSPRARHLTHCHGKTTQPVLKAWIDSLRDVGLMPQMLILATSQTVDPFAEEQRLIRLHFDAVLNIRDYLAGRKEARVIDSHPRTPYKVTLSTTEADCIRKALTDANGNVSAAARAVGVSRPSFYNRLVRHKIDPILYRASVQAHIEATVSNPHADGGNATPP